MGPSEHWTDLPPFRMVVPALRTITLASKAAAIWSSCVIDHPAIRVVVPAIGTAAVYSETADLLPSRSVPSSSCPPSRSCRRYVAALVLAVAAAGGRREVAPHLSPLGAVLAACRAPVSGSAGLWHGGAITKKQKCNTTAQRVLTSFFCDTQGMAKKYAHMANTYTVRIGSARGVDCRCFCCFARKKVFRPTRWGPLLGLFKLKIAAEAALGHI